MNKVNKRSEMEPRAKCPVPVRREVWCREFGNRFFGQCPLCHHTIIDALNFECGHKIAFIRGGSSRARNLRPICSACNKSMHTTSWHEFQQEVDYFNHFNHFKHSLHLPHPKIKRRIADVTQKRRKNHVYFPQQKIDSLYEQEFLRKVMTRGHVTCGTRWIAWPSTLTQLGQDFKKWLIVAKNMFRYKSHLNEIVRDILNMTPRSYLLPPFHVAQQKFLSFHQS